MYQRLCQMCDSGVRSIRLTIEKRGGHPMKALLPKISVRQAMQEVKRFEWEGDYRAAAREAIKRVLEGAMRLTCDHHLEELFSLGEYDRRNGFYERHLLTEVGDVVLSVARTRKFSAKGILEAYRRRSKQVDRAILDCFLLGCSTRKVVKVLESVLGERISPQTVSRVAKQLDRLVSAYHRRKLSDRYRFLLFDGVVLKRKTGVGATKKVVLVALGITHDNRKEVIDFMVAQSESQAAWEAFLGDLYRRGLCGENACLIVTDGGAGLVAAVELIYPRVPHQRCWAHKTRNVLNCVRKSEHQTVKKDLHKISHAKNIRQAQIAASRFAYRWKNVYPKAVKTLVKDIESLLEFYRINDPNLWTQLRTTNAIERRFEEVKRRTRPMGVFADNTSMERILFAVFSYENYKEKTCTPFALTQNY